MWQMAGQLKGNPTWTLTFWLKRSLVPIVIPFKNQKGQRDAIRLTRTNEINTTSNPAAFLILYCSVPVVQGCLSPTAGSTSRPSLAGGPGCPPCCWARAGGSFSAPGRGSEENSVVQRHGFFFPFFLAAPLKMAQAVKRVPFFPGSLNK